MADASDAADSVADASLVVEAAVIAPLRQAFHYRYSPQLTDGEPPAAGSRLWVPFGRGHRIAIVLSVGGEAPPDVELKTIAAVLDDGDFVPPALLKLAQWAARYYRHPLGDVVQALLPTVLRRNRRVPVTDEQHWRLTAAGHTAQADGDIRGKRQRELLAVLQTRDTAAPVDFAALGFDWRSALARMQARGWVEVLMRAPPSPVAPAAAAITLNAEQRAAARRIDECRGGFAVVVLDGVTGSGKTEVYFEAIAAALGAGQQVLVLVPEITLTHQLVARFRTRFGELVGVLHSALGDGERARTWLACRARRVRVLIGTRSAVWVPLPELGLVIVDEEHDPSFKQAEGFRYSARDVAIVRAQQAGLPIVLGSATPGLDTLANVERGKYQIARLTRRARDAELPQLGCSDVRGLKLEAGLGPALLNAMDSHLGRGEQVMLFLNRRGYAPVLMCRGCGEPRRCRQCDAYLVYHKGGGVARCHHCDSEWSVSRAAGCCDNEDVAPIGLGTERLEEAIAERFPERRVCRIDRDTVRRPAQLGAMLEDIAARRYDILIGTQMVAKGLDFSGITLVGVVDADNQLFSVDFRAEERLAQLLVQVSGRAGRAGSPGTVLIQTHQPRHPVLLRIINEGYQAYAAGALAERRDAGLPPYAAMAVIRADARDPAAAQRFLGELRQALLGGSQRIDAEVSLPLPALMERRAGRFRALLAIRGQSRHGIGWFLDHVVARAPQLARRHRVRWAIDVDPQDTL